MRVARTLKGLDHHNSLVLRRVKVYFQMHPGKHGQDATRGIADVEYTLRVGGRVVDRGKTAADGSVEMLLPASQEVELEALGTRYVVLLRGALEDVSTVKGYQQRLSILGYEIGEADGLHEARTDRAAMNFEADHGLEPDHKFGAHERQKLVSEAG
jgi:hypothetical protein